MRQGKGIVGTTVCLGESMAIMDHTVISEKVCNLGYLMLSWQVAQKIPETDLRMRPLIIFELLPYSAVVLVQIFTDIVAMQLLFGF